MNSICLIAFCAVIATCSATLTISRTGVITADAQCSNAVDKEKCTLQLCKEKSPTAFECAALDCKLRTPSNKQAILDCVTGVCSLKKHEVCGGITECEKIRDSDAVLGQSKYIICITKLFPKEA